MDSNLWLTPRCHLLAHPIDNLLDQRRNGTSHRHDAFRTVAVDQRGRPVPGRQLVLFSGAGYFGSRK